MVKCKIVKYFCKQNSIIAYYFQAKVAARGYHVYKNTIWEEAKCGDSVLIDLETDEKSIEIDPYQSHGWLIPTIKSSGTYSERNLPTCLFLPERGKWLK